jgi:hypothetical protein
VRSFLNHNNIFTFFGVILLALPMIAGIITACSVPSDEEMDKRYIETTKNDLLVISPRPGVECYILRGNGSGTPRAMSCIGGVPVTMGQ